MSRAAATFFRPLVRASLITSSGIAAGLAWLRPPHQIGQRLEIGTGSVHRVLSASEGQNPKSTQGPLASPYKPIDCFPHHVDSETAFESPDPFPGLPESF
jgi:hypothetical protein